MRTPGPWRAVGCEVADCWCGMIVSDALPESDPHHVVLSAGGSGWDDAVLMAEAPALIEALRYYINAERPEDTCGGGYWSLVDDGAVARDALAKLGEVK